MWRTDCPDHPDIARAMREGDPEGTPVYCPVCGAEFETAYEDAEGNIVGCGIWRGPCRGGSLRPPGAA